MADNFHFDMTGVGLEKALAVAFSEHPIAVAWAETPTDTAPPSPGGVWGSNLAEKRLVLFWTVSSLPRADYHLFPGNGLRVDAAFHAVRGWLDSAEYGGEPDQDGSNEKGHRVYNEVWGHVAGKYQAFVAIEPVWLMHGK